MTRGTLACRSIEAQDCRQPAWVAEALVAGLPRVTEEQTAKRADLQKQLDELETQRTAIEQQNDATVNELRTANPDLNAREEQLKQQEETARLRFYQRVSEWHKAAGGVGWLLRPGAVRKAREAMEQANVDWVDGNARLTEVRNSWQTLEKKSSEAETNLQAAWRLRTAEIDHVHDRDGGGGRGGRADAAAAPEEQGQGRREQGEGEGEGGGLHRATPTVRRARTCCPSSPRAVSSTR